MRFRYLIFDLVAILFFSGVLAAPLIRVLLDEVSDPVNLQILGSHRGYIDGQLRFSTGSGLSWPLQAYYDQIYIDGQAVGHSFTLEPTDSNFVSWQGTSYRGALRFVAEGNQLLVINVLDLESYLRGVVPAEMQASWPLEALKAQAIAARTYILASLEQDKAYDICATTDCQKYGGVNVEYPNSDQAVAETEGQVLTYDGVFAKTYYHSDSGGVIASSSEVWGSAAPYLISFQDAQTDTPHRNWDATLDPAVMAASLQANGKAVGTVRNLTVLAYSESGRASEVEIDGSAGSVILSGPSMTKMLRSWGLKSTRFRMVSGLSARGNGWGHGVGMSQYGAKGLADEGYSYQQILSFYYPTTSLQHVNYVVSGNP